MTARWQDGGPLDPPEAREVDVPDFLRSHACGACGRMNRWREGPPLKGAPTWVCACGEDLTEDQLLDALADEDQAARDDEDNRRVDALRGK